MKRIKFIPLILVFVACNSGNDESGTVDSTSAQSSDTITTYSGIDSSTEFLDTFSNEIVPWLQQSVKSNTVTLKGLRYADNWVEDSIIVSSQDLSKDFLKTYESMIVYSPDKSKVLDLGSYGSVAVKDRNGKTSFQGDADTEVAVIDLASKKRRRLLFFGPGTSVDHGFWLNDKTVLVTGQFHESNNVSVPVIWKIEIEGDKNLVTRYEYTVK